MMDMDCMYKYWYYFTCHIMSHFERDLAVGRVKLGRVAFGARQGKQD